MYGNLKVMLYNHFKLCNMFKRLKPISKTSLEGIVYQIRYLINDKCVSDQALAWHLQKILSDKGIPVDNVPSPKPWEWKKKT